MAVSSGLPLVAPGCDLFCATADFAHAYKHIPILGDQRDFATILLDPPTGPLKVDSLRTQPFGSRRPPTNWPRVALFLKWLRMALFGTAISDYTDDVFIAEPDGGINSSFHVFGKCGPCSGSSSRNPNNNYRRKPPSLLGAEITIALRWITARLPDRKRKEITNVLKQCVHNGHLTPAQAAKLRGRLGFCQSLMFGRIGRALLKPLSGRKYSKTQGRFHPMNDQLGLSLNWWVHALENADPRRTLLAPPKPILVYCDASGSGHIGCVAIYNGERRMGHTHLPGWLAESTGIYEFEMRSALYAFHAVSLIWPFMPILLCADNSSAANTLIRGTCTHPWAVSWPRLFGPQQRHTAPLCGSMR